MSERLSIRSLVLSVLVSAALLFAAVAVVNLVAEACRG